MAFVAKPKTYPLQDFTHACREKGLNVVVMWEMKGPPHTGVQSIGCYVLSNSNDDKPPSVVMVQGMKDDGGWIAYKTSPSAEYSKTIDWLVS